MTLSVLARKARTFLTTVRYCANWFEVTRDRFLRPGARTVVRLRRGGLIEPLHGLDRTWGEIFEPAVADLYRIAAVRPDLIVDVGANVGAFCVLAGQCHPEARIVAFEPSAAHAAQLRRNLELNGQRHVTLHELAVTRDGREIQFAEQGAGGSSGIFLPGEKTTRLPSTTLEVVDFTGVRELFVKLDCEGAEAEIIPWLCERVGLLPPRVRIGCEFHSWAPVSLAELERQLRAAGFAVQTPILFDEQYLFAERG